MGDHALYEAFGGFMASHRPGVVMAPTQKPGVIG
jgi:hypothetical protein